VSRFFDGNWSGARFTGPHRPVFPFAGQTYFYIEQDCRQDRTHWAPMAIGTAHPTLVGFALLQESAPTHVGGGVLEWTRTYGPRPQAWSDYDTHAYSFIGLFGTFGINVIEVTGRERFTETVPSRRLHDYFLVGPGGDFADPSQIPILPAQQYYLGSPTLTLDYLADSPPFNQATSPSRSAYLAMVDAGAEIVAEDSSIQRWMGNIWERVTRYIVAR
jgi:hypothetical protein